MNDFQGKMLDAMDDARALLVSAELPKNPAELIGCTIYVVAQVKNLKQVNCLFISTIRSVSFGGGYGVLVINFDKVSAAIGSALQLDLKLDSVYINKDHPKLWFDGSQGKIQFEDIQIKIYPKK